MMEAANKGAHQAGGSSIALGISLPFEQGVNEYATPELSFEFHYFFIRKFYFLYHAKAVVVFPGGFGTMDELFETLTLAQTGKLDKKLPVFLYGKEFWDGLINFDHFVKWGVISPEDADLFKIVDGVEEAFSEITACLPPQPDGFIKGAQILCSKNGKQGKSRLEVLRDRSAKRKSLIRLGMNKTQSMGMQHDSGKFIPVVLGCFIAINAIPGNGMSDGRKVNPNLMRPPCADPTLDQCEFLPVRGKRHPFRMSRLASFFNNRHFHPELWVTPDGKRKLAFVR